MKWNFENTTKKPSLTGYESVIDKLKTYTRIEYTNETTTEERKQEMIEEVFDIYRGENIFPIQYFNEQGIKKEIQKCIDKVVDPNSWNEVLNLKFNQGSSLCKFLFPNLHKVNCKNTKNNSMYDRFYDDKKLKRAIDFSLRFKKSVTPSEIRTSLELIGGNVATNFKTMNAQALYERYCPKGGVIYDYACGFGGRVLGALTSKNEYKYFGVEPCKETYNSLLELGKHIEETTDRKNIFKVYNKVSEDFMIKENYVDFAFSSPPYFNLEVYSSEETQCYIKYPTLEEWFSGYVQPTIQNIYKMLKKDRYYAVNISDFNIGKTRVEYVNRWLEISKEVGFEFVEKISMKISTRKGVGHQENGKDKPKQEGIFVFRKV